MVGGQSLLSNGKISKRATDINTGYSKRRRQHETDENVTAFAQSEEQGHSSDRVSPIPSPETMDIDDYQDSDTSIQENMDTSTEVSDTPAQEFIKKFAENVLLVDVDFSKKASKEKAGLSKVLEAEMAMRNTCGGVIILNVKEKDVQDFFQKRDDWLKKLQEMRERKLSQVKNPDTFDEILDFKDEEFSLIFVRKSSIVLTDESKCILQRCETRNQRVTSFPEICSVLKGNDARCCCESDQRKIKFILGNKMPFPESKTAEYKYLTGKDLPTLVRQELRDYIPAFANTAGGTIYFGIKDDASILGQKITSKEDQKNLCRKIEECMNSKLWIKDSGKMIKPVEEDHYSYEFIPVDGAEVDTYIIEIHICKFAGTVFLGEPYSPVLNEDNEIVKMDFQKWLALHNSSLTGKSDYQERFVETKRGTSTYYSVEQTVKKFVEDMTSASAGQLRLHPSHAAKWISHPALDLFIKATKKTFQEKAWHSGIAYIERCWEVNLGLSSTKPDDVICDVLLCCPQMPLVFVSLTHSDIPNEASCSYNKKVATKLKATLVQEANCLEKFYVKAIVISRSQLEAEGTTWIYSENPSYPVSYRMINNTFSNILEALVLVLARANVMSSHIVGQGLFNLLTHEQYEILHEFYETSPKVKITGPPGSGKTVLALERIHRLRNGGCCYEEVLFLCSYKPLKARVENMKTGDGQPLCIVKTYYEVESLVESYEGFDIELGNVKHILADEAQNFQESTGNECLDWWSKLHDLCDGIEDSSFWVFFDVAQKINTRRSVSLRRFSEKQLKTVIRQTGNIHKFITSKYMKVDKQVQLGHNFKGSKVDLLVPSASCPTDMHLVYILTSQLHKLIVKYGHHNNNITVLFHDTKQKDHYQPLFVRCTNNSCPVRSGAKAKEHGVIFDTIRRYCGVDDNIVIGFCPEFYTSGSQDNDALMTTLCSRTKLKLILIFKDEQEAQRFHLAPAELKKVQFGDIRKVSNFSR